MSHNCFHPIVLKPHAWLLTYPDEPQFEKCHAMGVMLRLRLLEQEHKRVYGHFAHTSIRP